MSSSYTSATVATVPCTTTSASLLTANGARSNWVVENLSGQTAYIRFGTGAASSTDYTKSLATGGYYECPQPLYRGAVQIVLGAGSGNVQVTSW